jgi:LacI family transcriptional regulator
MTPTGRPPTRVDVARLAGVSTAVVSYVVNNGPGPVAAATRVRVLDAIRALGYRPNASARALATGSSRLLGLIVADITNPFFSSLAVSIEAVARERGYALLLANSGDDTQAELAALSSLVRHNVDGILLSSVLPGPDILAARQANVPLVLMNSFDPYPGVMTVGVDAAEGAYLATRHLIEHGHTNISLIIGPVIGSDLEAREAGWLRALDEADLAPGPVGRSTFDREGGYSAARQLFRRRDHATAVFVSSDLQAIGALSALHSLSLRVPDDVAVISYDGTPESKFSIPPLTTVRQPVAEIASRLVDLILSDDPTTDPQHTLLAPELIVRDSCGRH